MAKRQKNEIWVTRTSIGYCTRISDKLANGSHYLDMSPHNLLGDVKAVYLSFPNTITALTQISNSFYSHGIKLAFDKHRQARIPKEESDAITCVVHSLEDLATLAAKRRTKIYDAINLLKQE